jgi:hypothetical protein
MAGPAKGSEGTIENTRFTAVPPICGTLVFEELQEQFLSWTV